MKRLLLKLTTESTFIFNDKFYKQSDGCTMGGPLSVIFSNIFMTKLEDEVVIPVNPEFYRRFVDDSITKRKKNQPDKLFEKLNAYHDNIKFTCEVQPDKFLDTKIEISNGTIVTSVYRKITKLPVHWVSKIPKKYKRNSINGDLSRASKIATNFQHEIEQIRTKFKNAGYPPRFIECVIRNFREKARQKEADVVDEYIIPPNFFDIPKPFILLEIPFCYKNERISHHFLKKFHDFTGEKYQILIKWVTRKVKSLFRLKSQNPHPSCKIYEGVCSCGETYIGETKRNVAIRWHEHNTLSKKSEPAKHLKDNIDHEFTWRVLFSAPYNKRQRKNLEASEIALRRPTLNNQLETKILMLFRNGIT